MTFVSRSSYAKIVELLSVIFSIRALNENKVKLANFSHNLPLVLVFLAVVPLVLDLAFEVVVV